jgi:hypothetical protein
VGWLSKYNAFQVYDPPGKLKELTEAELGVAMDRTVLVVSNMPLPPLEDLAAFGFSWHFYAGLEVVCISLACFLITLSRRRTLIKEGALSAVLFGLLLQTGCSHGVEMPPRAANASASGDMYTIDLGEIQKGTEMTATFKRKNKTASPFRIRSVERSCQCQDVSFDGENFVAVGDESCVSVLVPTDRFSGPVKQQMIVHASTDWGAAIQIVLELKANVISRVRSVPAELMFGTICTVETRQCRFLTNPAAFSSAYRAFNTSEFVSAELAGSSPGELIFNVRLSDDLPSGPFEERLSVTFADLETEEYSVRIIGRKEGPLNVVPGKLTIDARRGSQVRKVRVASTRDESFRLLSCTAPAGASPVWDKEAAPQKHHIVQIFIADPAVLREESILFKSDLNGDSDIRIPISITNQSIGHPE